MNVSLTPELEQLVQDKVKSGMYQTSSEVVREGLRLLKERDHQMEALRGQIQQGLAEVSNGQWVDLVDATCKSVADRVKTRGRQILALDKAKSTKK